MLMFVLVRLQVYWTSSESAEGSV